MVHFDKLNYEKYYDENGENFGHVNTRPGIRLHYNYHNRARGNESNIFKLMNVLDLDDTCRCALIGAGFNWTGEGLMEQGIQTVGTDISGWILAEKDNTEEADLREYISKTGLDPDMSEIIGNPQDTRCRLYIPEYKQNDWDKWIVGPEAEARRKMVAEWEVLSETEKIYRRRKMGKHSFNPKMPVAPKPEYMINPLECYLKGGRSAPQPRTSGIIASEGVDTAKSRTTVRGLLNDSLTHIITEHVLNGIDDEEGLILCENLAKMVIDHGGTVYHILSFYREPEYEQGPFHDSDLEVKPGTVLPPEFNWKTYENWRTFLDTNGFENQKILVGASTKEHFKFDEVL